jgi:hypothetical protein
MSEPLKIVFGLLSTYERSGWHHPSITQFFADLPCRTGYAYRVVPIKNFVPAASGRNVFCKNFNTCDADWLCMIDNDMEIPENLIDSVKDAPADAGIVVPVFYLWDQSGLKLTLCWGMDQEPVLDGPTGELAPGFHELSKCGTGVIFIRPAVLRAMSYPYFRYLYNEDQGMQGTEDIQFCLAARAQGIKIYGNASVKVGHYHSVEISSMWKWFESVNKIDTSPDKGVISDTKDAECSSVPLTAKACSADANERQSLT